MSSTSLTDKVLNNKWRLGAPLGSGACADVYEATDVSAGGVTESGKFVAKVSPLPEDIKTPNMLYWEHTLYHEPLRPLRELGCVVEIPKDGFGEDQNLRYLVMTRLGPNVQAAQENSEPWSVSATAGYAQQMLQLLRVLHERCEMVFVDVKPENFLFGPPDSDDKDKIFLVDFGLSDMFRDRHGSFKPHKHGNVQGTPKYLSLECHGGRNAGRCDDLESLGYVIVSMLKKGTSELPWSGSTSNRHGLDMKRNTSLETLCHGCPTGMLKYMRAVRALKYEETPNYDELDAMLQSLQENDTGGTARAASAAEPASTGVRTRGAATQGAVVSRMSKRKRGGSQTDAVRPSSDHPMTLRRSRRSSL